jgi:hypothetical protein
MRDRTRTEAINPADPQTWIAPVESSKGQHPVTRVNIYKAEYIIPMSPNALMMAMLQLPREVPRGPVTFIRTRASKANVERDGRHLGGFIIEAVWPPVDLASVPLDMEEGEGVQAKRQYRRRSSR